MKTTVAMITEHDEKAKTETWRYRHCDSLVRARQVAKEWSIQNPDKIVEIGKGFATGKNGDFFCELNPFEEWMKGEGTRVLEVCVWSPGKPMKFLPKSRKFLKSEKIRLSMPATDGVA